MPHSRCKTLFGDDFNRLQNSTILVVGIGGVGGYTVDCLYRSGVCDITVVDYDKFEISNQNRQIGSKHLNQPKTEVFKMLYPNIKIINQKISANWVLEFDFDRFDIVVDAIDDIDAKVALIKKCHKKLISSMGSAKRVDATKIKVSDIWKTYNDKFAKRIRERLKKDKFNKKVTVVFSNELQYSKEMGSFVAVTGVFGLTICSLVIKKLLDGVFVKNEDR